MIEIFWDAEGSTLFMEAVQDEDEYGNQYIRVGRHTETLQTEGNWRHGSFDTEDVESYTSGVAELDPLLKDFGRYYKK